MANWMTELDQKIFTLVKSKSITTLVSAYPDVFYTTSNESQTTTKFPTIYFENVSSVEIDSDLDNDIINAVTLTYEIQIKVDSATYSSDDCYEVLGEILDAYKALHFSLVSTSSPTCLDGVWTLYARFRRTVGSDDEL